MTSAELPDADLVAGVLAGDRSAFAGIYEKYADRLFDFAHSMTRNREEAADAVADSFVVMAEKVGQLRDASRLRPWLYSVVRNECLRTLRARARVAHDDEWLEAMPDQGNGPEQQVEQEAVQAELQALVWDAIEGLNDRDRALLDLHLRQGLEGPDLAAAMDVTTANSYVMLSRARDQVERALGALLIARRGSDDCEELAALLSDWDGTFSPLIRKRVARHIDGCETCESRRKLMISPLALLAGVPAMAAPAALKDRVLDDPRLVGFYSDGPTVGGPLPSGGTTEATRARLRPPLVALIVALVVLGGWATVSCWPDGTDDTVAIDAGTTPSSQTPATNLPPATQTTPSGSPSEVAQPSGDPTATEGTTDATSDAPTIAAPGELTVSTRTVDLGRSDSARTITVGNAGGTALDFTTESRTSWLSIGPGGSLDPESSRGLQITASRSGLSEGPHEGTVAVSWSGGTVVITVRLTVNRPPTIGTITRTISGDDCTSAGRIVSVSAMANDGTGLASVRFSWNGPGPEDGAKAGARSGSSWSANLGRLAWGDYTLTVTARDNFGATTTKKTTFTVDPCPG
ncbi:sigma-70 family RNA polymerase sigma factor [Nocardioides caeni]|nr:sigma-70 family RNA polymerase sigma factor [Nocardioides caeni]